MGTTDGLRQHVAGARLRMTHARFSPAPFRAGIATSQTRGAPSRIASPCDVGQSAALGRHSAVKPWPTRAYHHPDDGAPVSFLRAPAGYLEITSHSRCSSTNWWRLVSLAPEEDVVGIEAVARTGARVDRHEAESREHL